jgi:hypothetical protein
MNLEKQKEFEKALAQVINRFSMENESNTPDFILGQFCSTMLGVLAVAIQQRETWYGKIAQPSEKKECAQGHTPHHMKCICLEDCPCHNPAPALKPEKDNKCLTCGQYLGTFHLCKPPETDAMKKVSGSMTLDELAELLRKS